MEIQAESLFTFWEIPTFRCFVNIPFWNGNKHHFSYEIQIQKVYVLKMHCEQKDGGKY